jgi:hypothetical protein
MVSTDTDPVLRATAVVPPQPRVMRALARAASASRRDVSWRGLVGLSAAERSTSHSRPWSAK